MNPFLRSLVRGAIRRLDGEDGLARLNRMPLHDTGFGYDRFGCERESFWAAYLASRQLYRRYFRVQSRGIEDVPTQGRVILASNHSGLLPFDGAMISVDLMEKLEPPRAVRAIVDHFAFAVPWVGTFMLRTGQVPGTARNFTDLLREDEAVLVFPEGTPGIIKRYRNRYRLRPFRVGFLELALENKAPIVPVAVVGAEEQAPILFGSERLGRPLGMPIFPITPTFPLLGPLGLVPYPSRYYISYGKPIHLHEEYPPESASDPEVLRGLAARVQDAVQELVDEGLAWRADGRPPTQPAAGATRGAQDSSLRPAPQESSP